MYSLSENVFFKFFSNSVNKPFFKIIKSCILIEERLQRLLLYSDLKKKMHPKCDIGGQISKLLIIIFFTSS